MNRTPINPHEHDWLDKILAGPDEYIDDGGFTGHVMNRLPPRRYGSRQRALIFSCAALLSMAFFVWSVPGLTALYMDFVDFLYAQSLPGLSALALAICAATSAVTWWLMNPD